MTDQVTASRSEPDRTRAADGVLGFAAFIGVVLGVLGVIVGLRMALHAKVVDCANGTYFPEGTTDFRCFAHPHAGEGTGLALVAAMLTILVLLAVWLVRATLGARSDDATLTTDVAAASIATTRRPDRELIEP